MLLKANLYRFSVFSFKKTQKTCYDILGIDRRAHPEEVKAAYFGLVKKVHPDQNKEADAEEKFKEIVKAYETLKDPVRRQIYDLDNDTPGYDINQAGQGFSAGYGSNDTYYKDQSGKKFYENRWYGYRKPTAETQHDESQLHNEKLQKIDELTFYAIIKRMLIIIGLYAAIDFYRMNAKRRHESFLNVQKEILLGQLVVQNKAIEDYIQERQESFEDDEFDDL